MVKTHRILPTPLPHAQRLDPARIGGISAALAVHLIAFGLLLMPAQRTWQPAWIEQRTRVEPVLRTLPPPPPPPMEVSVVKPRTRVLKPADTAPPRVPSLRAADSATLPTAVAWDPPAVLEHGSEALPPAEGAVGAGDSGEPLPGVALQYLTNPPPPYPRQALNDGLEGTVLLRVLVDEHGHPLQVEIAASSGQRALDRAAREQVLRRWRFLPAQREGRAVRAIGTVPVVFRIER